MNLPGTVYLNLLGRRQPLRVAVGCGVMALVAFLAAGCGPRPTTSSAEGELAGVELDGAVLYEQYCSLCHGDQAQGYAADNANALNNATFLATASDAFLWTAIDRGRPGTAMGAYGQEAGGPLSKPQISALIEHLRGFQTMEAIDVDELVVAGDAEAGKEVFAVHCASCHGEEGSGATALSLNNPIFLATASDGFIRYAIEHGRPGTPMAAYGEALPPKAHDDLTALIRSWATNAPELVGGQIPPTFEQVVIHPDGPDPDFPELREGRYLGVDVVHEAYKAGAKMVILDARPTSDWLRSHIPGALPVPYYDSTAMITSLPKDGTWILAYCGCPHAASGRVMDTLREAGFPNTAVIDEGVYEWMKRGYPTTSGASP